MKRITWFVTGAAAGATGASYATKKIKHKASQMAPVNVAKGAAGKAKQGGRRVVDAVRKAESRCGPAKTSCGHVVISVSKPSMIGSTPATSCWSTASRSIPAASSCSSRSGR